MGTVTYTIDDFKIGRPVIITQYGVDNVDYHLYKNRIFTISSIDNNAFYPIAVKGMLNSGIITRSTLLLLEEIIPANNKSVINTQRSLNESTSN